jgi:hypothetical protein
MIVLSVILLTLAEASNRYSTLRPNASRSFRRLTLVDFAIFVMTDLQIGRASSTISLSNSQNNSARIELFYNLSLSVPLLSMWTKTRKIPERTIITAGKASQDYLTCRHISVLSIVPLAGPASGIPLKLWLPYVRMTVLIDRLCWLSAD